MAFRTVLKTLHAPGCKPAEPIEYEPIQCASEEAAREMECQLIRWFMTGSFENLLPRKASQ